MKGKDLLESHEVEPQFRSLLVRGPGKVDEIKSRLDEVYKVIKKAQLITTQPGGANPLINFLKELGSDNTNGNNNIEYRVSQAFNFKPTLKQFQDIVAKWNDGREKWENHLGQR